MTDDWWRGSVTYQIYPRSFQDSHGDGVGDLRGITRRLSQVADLGVDAVWLGPFFRSPMVDMGYDVADRRDVDPLFGTFADFDAMLAEAHCLGVKVIIDQVLNHTSDRHPLFRESRASRDNARANWCVWADPRPEGTPPNDWRSVFGSPAWEWDARRFQYHLHNFMAAQPDLNFHEPAVQDWALDTLPFWPEDKGRDGCRTPMAWEAGPPATVSPPARPGCRSRSRSGCAPWISPGRRRCARPTRRCSPCAARTRRFAPRAPSS